MFLSLKSYFILYKSCTACNHPTSSQSNLPLCGRNSWLPMLAFKNLQPVDIVYHFVIFLTNKALLIHQNYIFFILFFFIEVKQLKSIKAVSQLKKLEQYIIDNNKYNFCWIYAILNCTFRFEKQLLYMLDWLTYVILIFLLI